jgi:predicted alpha/beta superfamily hydrolase
MTGKSFVWAWGVGVVGVLAGMWGYLHAQAEAVRRSIPTAGVTAPAVVDEQGKGAGGASGAAAPAGAGAKAGAGKVQPESLAQGFIVVVTDETRTASAASPIYMPSSHNGWNPGDPKMKLEPQSDMKWRIEWSKPTLDSRVAFKFARGSWDAVETDAEFKDVENRMLPLVDASKLAPGEKPVIEFTVKGWKDKAPGGATKASATDRYRPIAVGAGTLRRVEVVGGGGVPSLVRDVLVWLPPGYEDRANESRRYPVLYLMDGQNVFERLPGVPGEWGADETAARLIAEGKIEPLIIVGVPSAGAPRAQEYLTYPMVEGVTPRGAEFVDFLTGEVKPRVDRAFRTRPEAESTGVGGASLGASIALDAAQLRPDAFGKVLMESLPMVAGKRAAFAHFARAERWPAKVWFGMGGKEDPKNAAVSEQSVAGAQAFAELARGKGLDGSRLRVQVDPEAEHNEVAWGKRLGAALEFLYPAK